MNRDKLRGRIIEKFGTQGAFAKALGIEANTLSYKLNERRVLTRPEIATWCKLLGISEEEIGSYFFTDRSVIFTHEESENT